MFGGSEMGKVEFFDVRLPLSKCCDSFSGRKKMATNKELVAFAALSGLQLLLWLIVLWHEFQ